MYPSTGKYKYRYTRPQSIAAIVFILFLFGDNLPIILFTTSQMGGGPRVVVSTAAFHARVRRSLSGLGGLKETKMFLPHPRVKLSIVRSLRDREVACSASDHRGSNFESCFWRTVSSHSSHHPQEVLLTQFSLHVHKWWPEARLISFHLQRTKCHIPARPQKVPGNNDYTARLLFHHDDYYTILTLSCFRRQ